MNYILVLVFIRTKNCEICNNSYSILYRIHYKLQKNSLNTTLYRVIFTIVIYKFTIVMLFHIFFIKTELDFESKDVFVFGVHKFQHGVCFQ